MFEELLTSPDQITFAVLFVGLLIYVMRENNNRENQYRQTIDRLTKALGTLDDIEEKLDRLTGRMSNKEVG